MRNFITKLIELLQHLSTQGGGAKLIIGTNIPSSNTSHQLPPFDLRCCKYEDF
jgi:hypothetical protein